MDEFSVKFTAQRKTVRVKRGTDILTAAVKCGIPLSASCGGEGLCGKCRVTVTAGKFRAGDSRLVSAADRKKGVVLSCQTIVEGDLEVSIGSSSLEERGGPDDASREFTPGGPSGSEKAFAFSPLVRKVAIEVPGPSQDDNMPDLDRVCDALKAATGKLHVSTRLAGVKHLQEVLRDSDYKVTAVLAYKDDSIEILAFEPGDTSKANYGFAFDIGTTTVAGQLIDLAGGAILGTRIAFNRQSVYGSDVITRIIYASSPEGLEKLNAAVIGNINEMISDLATQCGVGIADVYAVVCAGNMTMMHLLLKIDPSNIRKAPYVPATSVFPPVHPSELGIRVNPKGIVSFLPGVSTYVGGDTVAGVLACGLFDSDKLSLLIDIGTNGEVVLGNAEWMIGAAASAGPAFEGSGMSCGMKAVAGAINRVEIGDGLKVTPGTIGGGKPEGICGSGYIDLLCQMRRRGIIAKDGKIDPGIRSGRIRKAEGVREFVVAFGADTASGRDITVTEDDIENLKRSKGAIYSAVAAILKRVDKKISDVEKIYIAGGFGSYLNIESSIYIGLLPDTARQAYSFIGNSSLTGARVSLVSHEAYEKTLEIYRKITYLDLGSDPAYMDEYIASLFFPHTDAERFPSVR
jgi:uncharacterized 2Fe-2S/4Fe-4S cluster protein (DUF4445 family)